MTNFSKFNAYIAVNTRDHTDNRIVRLVSVNDNGYTFMDVCDGFTFVCGSVNVGAYTGHTQAVDVRRNGTHYKVSTKDALR